MFFNFSLKQFFSAFLDEIALEFLDNRFGFFVSTTAHMVQTENCKSRKKDIIDQPIWRFAINTNDNCLT